MFLPSQQFSEPISKRPLLPPAIGGTADSNFNPRNTQRIPVVKIFAFLDLESRCKRETFSNCLKYFKKKFSARSFCFIEA